MHVIRYLFAFFNCIINPVICGGKKLFLRIIKIRYLTLISVRLEHTLLIHGAYSFIPVYSSTPYSHSVRFVIVRVLAPLLALVIAFVYRVGFSDEFCLVGKVRK